MWWGSWIVKYQGYKSSIGDEFFDSDILNNAENFETDKSRWKRNVVLEFIEDADMQRVFYGMPERFFLEARDLISRWDEIGTLQGKGRISKLQGRALDLSMLAVETMITTRFPLRLETVVKIVAFGKDPHIIFPKSREKPVRVNIPGYIVKNGHLFAGVPLLASRSIDPREVLNWYLENVHHLVIEHKVRGKNKAQHLLFGGITKGPMALKYRRYSAEAGLALDSHMVRHLAGSILYARGTPVEVIAELLGISEETVLRNYVQINRSRIRQQAIDEISMIYKELDL